MKKLILPILLFMMFIPFIVNAETCDTDKISISSITVEEKSDNVEEIDEASASGKNINLNLSMSEVGDNINYKIIVKNDSNEDYELDKNSFNISSDYIEYTIESDDNSNIVKANSSKTVYLKVEYKTEVPDEVFESGAYNDNKTIAINLSTNSSVDNIINPNTRVQSYIIIFILILIISVTLYVILRKKKYAQFMILIVGIAIIIPVSVYALCKCNINIESNVKISNKTATLKSGIEVCSLINKISGYYSGGCFNGDAANDFVKKLIITNNKPNSLNFSNENIISINESEYPIYMGYDENNQIIYLYSEANKIYTNVNSEAMFYGLAELEEFIGLNLLNTSNTTNMSWMFGYGTIDNLESLDLSSFDTSNVTNMSWMFSGANGGIDIARLSLDLSNFNTNNLNEIYGMFASSMNLKTINLSSFDTKNVYNFSQMFSYSQNLEKIYATNRFVIIRDQYGNVEDNSMFLGCTSLVGGNGTVYDSNNVDSEYARIDTISTPGYFTDVAKK